MKDPVTFYHGIVADEMDVFHKYIIAQNQKNRNGFELLIGAKEATLKCKTKFHSRGGRVEVRVTGNST